MLFWIGLLVLLIGVTAALIAGDTSSIGGIGGDTIAGITAAVALLIIVGSGVLGSYSGRMTQALRDAVTWIAIALVLVIAYSFRDDLRPLYERVASELAPPGTAINVAGETGEERAVRVRKRANGHFVVQAEINGTSVSMLVDTGASSVVLSADDARAIGLDPSSMSYNVSVSTANGIAYAAPVRLPAVSVSGIRREGIQALIAQPGALNQSLLGMSFLRHLKSYGVSGDFLTLRG
ncbi:MAG: TIGR02281 family clan AA aspartic protease [Hyphomicrobiaceae bacterium]